MIMKNAYKIWNDSSLRYYTEYKSNIFNLDKCFQDMKGFFLVKYNAYKIWLYYKITISSDFSKLISMFKLDTCSYVIILTEYVSNIFNLGQCFQNMKVFFSKIKCLHDLIVYKI